MRGSEGDDSGEDTGRVMKRMCLSTQSVLSASPASIATISSASPSVCSALRAAVLVVAHLQPHLKLHLQHPGEAGHHSVIRRPRRGQSSGQTRVSLISGHAQKYSGSYALLAIAREPFELCPYFKSRPSVARRELSIDLTWLAHRPETQIPHFDLAPDRVES
jgi:hypothetical protein